MRTERVFRRLLVMFMFIDKPLLHLPGAPVQYRLPVFPQGLMHQSIFRIPSMGHRPGPRVAARGQDAAEGSKGFDVFHGAFQNLLHRLFPEPALAPEVSNGGKGGHPDGPTLCHGFQGLPV